MHIAELIRNGLALCLGLIVILSLHSDAATNDNTTSVISLAGQWSFELDPNDAGITGSWFNRSLPEVVKLPGSTDTNKKGTPNNRQPDMGHLSRLFEYAGAAWYEREIDIPAVWKGKRVTLFLERCHWETQVWLDGKPFGMQDSLCTPHIYELGDDLAPGPHRLTIRVDNRFKYDVGDWAHSVTEETQTNWNGIIGRIELRADAPVSIESLQVYPDVKAKAIKVKGLIRSGEKQPFELVLRVRERGKSRLVQSSIVKGDGFTGEKSFEVVINIPNVKLWDEFFPNLYELEATLSVKDKESDSARTVFGMRDLAVRDKRLVMNGRKIFMRGTLECCIFPRTGYPPTDVDSWMRIYKICKSYGLNHMRFHSWCPPEAAFTAADRMGFLVQVEAPQWVHNIGKDKPRYGYIRSEVQHILDTYGNHPSFGFLSMGNELAGDGDYLQESVDICQKHDPRHLYTSSTAFLHAPNNDYDVSGPRGLHGPTTDADFRDEAAKKKVPWVVHEIGQWAVLPNLAEIPKYDGVLRARNFELYRDNLKANGLLDQAEAFTQTTGKLSVTLYKEEIEVIMRTPGHSGFQLLDLHDFPGQGTALVGLLDAFWDSKGFITPEAYRRFCGPTVPLLRMSKRTYTTDETFTAKAEITHYGPKDIINAIPEWSITDGKGQVIASGTLPACNLSTGDLHNLGSISVPLLKVQAPADLTVTVSLKGTKFSNDWRIWIYPANVNTDAPRDVFVTMTTNETLEALKQGRKVLMLASRNYLVGSRPGHFTSVFWSTVLFGSQRDMNMGILCDPAHPTLAAFPTDSYTNWQWYDLLQNSRTMVLSGTPTDFRPIIQLADNFMQNKKLGNLLEAKVGESRLMVCSIDLWTDLDKRPAARQLLRSILDYMGSPKFDPQQRLTVEEVGTFLGQHQPPYLTTIGAIASADSEDKEGGNTASNAIDDNPGTIWHTQYQPDSPPYPHELRVDMQKSIEISGFKYLPRQDMDNGWFTDYEFYASEDGKDWGKPIARGTFASDAAEKTVRFEKPVTGRYLRLVALKGYAEKPWAAIAEFDVIRP